VISKDQAQVAAEQLVSAAHTTSAGPRSVRAVGWPFGIKLEALTPQEQIQLQQDAATHVGRHALLVTALLVWLGTLALLFYSNSPAAVPLIPIGVVVIMTLRRWLMKRFVRRRVASAA
jgi:hypothetical protein